MTDAHSLRWRSLQNPASQVVFNEGDWGKSKNGDVVDSPRNRGRHFIASTYPSGRDRQKRFKGIERRESKKDADGGAQRDRMRRVRDRHQRDVMLAQPLF